ncbi:GNAT family N-acetyltransferase, partial [Thermodesulfobacteriota bacterium]
EDVRMKTKKPRPLVGEVHFKIALHEDAVAGFLLALSPGAKYQSLNYRWFSEHYDQFIYVDRVVVSSIYAGSGFGKLLYEDLEQAALKEATVLTCEVNLKPANPNSLAFHQKLGFKEVGQQDTEGGRKKVCLMCKALNRS